MLKEVCVGSFTEALNAERKGADRIELCDNLEVGGTTPSYGTIKQAVSKIKIPVFVMIRPRGGNYCYNKNEIEIMKNDIEMCKSLGVKGVVLGVLTKNDEIDYDLLQELIELSSPMEVTFHKAIDDLENPIPEVPKLAKVGVKRILSSGTKAKALDGKNILNKMIKKASNKITIIVAGGVTTSNFEEVSKEIISTEYHGRKII
ncbi:MAG: copper homeostasis protein CutC [Fusobacterium perfoetens]|uniref:copper homeostasis protein CutC n=1 Tax=Fusobacterium perfoetens TaxID=852 RepID=UPI0023F06171|nr:copper homeostasis protein CutC [Fusobacterium perfoetens]MCI6152879.1 copper homeostasis protein CutC [Fusobacterium perfoetens]MDY3237291.1 copper homeostasis protein CutC [Fusobacterium perfoetens]